VFICTNINVFTQQT